MDWSALINVGRIAGWSNMFLIPCGIAAQLLFYRAVPGTHMRYVMNTIYTGYLVLEVIVTPLMAMGYITSGDRFWGPVYVAVVALSCYNLWFHRKHYGDEDNFWKGLGGRIKKLLTRPLRVLVPTTH